MRQAFSAILLAVASTTAFAQGQTTTGPILTLDEAVTLAIRNNPTHLRTISAQARTGAATRSAYGAFLPRVTSSFNTGFRAGGSEVVAGQQQGSPSDILNSSYNIGVSANYSAATFLQPSVAKANENAAEADVVSSAAVTRRDVVTQYLNTLQAQASAALQDTLVANAQAQVDLNRARESVGAATSLDVRRAEVQLGTARVNQLRAKNSVENEMLRLFQFMGVQRVAGTRLTTAFPVTEPKLDLNELLQMARVSNPAYNAAKARENAASVQARQARSQYLPSIGFQTGWSGNSLEQTNIEPQIASAQAQTAAARASCLTQDSLRVGAGLAPRGTCQNIQFTDADADAMRARNNQFPFTFSKNPWSYGIGISLPIFDGFRREEQIQNAEASRNDARYAVRAQELDMVTQITSAYNTLIAGYEGVKLQEQTAATSQQALLLAQERYRVGASTFTDVSQARADYEQASNTLIAAQYDFHKFYVALETAVGRPLR
jgi:outer membrane protein